MILCESDTKELFGDEILMNNDKDSKSERSSSILKSASTKYAFVCESLC